jgi:AAA domain
MYEVKVRFPDETTWDDLCLLARLATSAPTDQVAQMVAVGLPTALAVYQEREVPDRQLVIAGAAHDARLNNTAPHPPSRPKPRMRRRKDQRDDSPADIHSVPGADDARGVLSWPAIVVSNGRQLPSDANGDRSLDPSDYDLLLRLASGEPLPEPDQDGQLTSFGRELVGRYRQANGHADESTLTLALRQVLDPAAIDEGLWKLLAHEATPSVAASRFRALGLAELRKRPKPTYTVDRYLQADSLAVLEGVDGTYKTFVALAWAHCVGLGRPWLDRPVQKGRVLYLLGEGSRGLPKRADAWQIVNLGGRQDLDGTIGFVVDEMPQLWKGDASEVLAANPGPFALIVVDTLARAMVGGNENTQQDMGMLVAGCDELRRGSGGATVLILHHLNSTGGTRGSTSLPGAISTRLRLERQPGSRVVTLQVMKQREDEAEQAIALVARAVDLGTVDDRGRTETSLVLDVADADQQPTAPPSAGRLTPGETKALQTLLCLGEATFAAWRDASELAHSTWKDVRASLKKRGLVEQLPDGRYRVTFAGEEEGRRGPEQGRFVPPSMAEEEGRRGPESPLKDSGPRPSGPPLLTDDHGRDPALSDD